LNKENPLEKIIVAPQIVIYSNLIKNCDKFLNIIDNENKKSPLWPEWKDWYDQGKFMSQIFSSNDLVINEFDDSDRQIEKLFLQNIFESFNFIKEDYFKDYEGKKGNWPDYINQWEKIKESDKDSLRIDVYKYDDIYNEKDDLNDLLLQYHVDEMPELANKNIDHKIITLTIYPNDNYNGGEICFYDEFSNKAYEYKPKAGDITIFPSAAPFYHAVKHFNNGPRYFMRIFIYNLFENEKNWIKNNKLDFNKFEKDQEEKINIFVKKYGNMITVVEPEQEVKEIFGKAVFLNEKTKVIGKNK
jgi:hypothetical protein